jgi:hypothetical protein
VLARFELHRRRTVARQRKRRLPVHGHLHGPALAVPRQGHPAGAVHPPALLEGPAPLIQSQRQRRGPQALTHRLAVAHRAVPVRVGEEHPTGPGPQGFGHLVDRERTGRGRLGDEEGEQGEEAEESEWAHGDRFLMEAAVRRCRFWREYSGAAQALSDRLRGDGGRTPPGRSLGR